MSKSVKVCVSVLLLCAAAGRAYADFSATPATVIKSVAIALTVNGNPAKSALTVAMPKDDLDQNVRLGWTTSEGVKGCVNNWDDSTAATGHTAGVVTTSRVFVMTCYGLGAAQTARITVTAAKPDLSVSGFNVKNLAPVPGSTHAGEFYAANGDERTNLTLSGTVRNSGRLDVTGATYDFEYSDNSGTSWNSFGATSLPSPFKAAASKNVSFAWNPGPGEKIWLTRICAAVPTGVVEVSTTNNCSAASRPMKFVAH